MKYQLEDLQALNTHLPGEGAEASVRSIYDAPVRLGGGRGLIPMTDWFTQQIAQVQLIISLQKRGALPTQDCQKRCSYSAELKCIRKYLALLYEKCSKK